MYTFSIHGEHNYPTAKMRSSLDVALANGANDAVYLDALDQHLPTVLAAADFDIVFYLAGVDVAAGDRYGKLSLSEDGIRLRDQRVIRAVRSRGIPLVIVLAGGYADTRARTAELHAHAFREAVRFERSANQRAAQYADEAAVGAPWQHVTPDRMVGDSHERDESERCKFTNNDQIRSGVAKYRIMIAAAIAA